MARKIHYSIDADWTGGITRLTETQKRTIIEAVWNATFTGQLVGPDTHSIVLKETVCDRKGVYRTKVTVYDPYENKTTTS